MIGRTRFASFSVLLLLAAACSGGDELADTTPTPSPSVGESQLPPNTVELTDSTSGGVFAPRLLTVTAGTTVTWIQTGTSAHTVQSNTRLFNSHPKCEIKGAGPQFRESTGCMKSGDQYTYTFKTPGRYSYYCLPHGILATDPNVPASGMSGTITVT